MRLSRTDLLPMLTIVAGVALGASLSFGVLTRLRSEDVSVAVPVSATYETVEVFLEREWFKEALRLQERDRMLDEARESVRARVERLQRLRDQQERVEEGSVADETPT